MAKLIGINYSVLYSAMHDKTGTTGESRKKIELFILRITSSPFWEGITHDLP
jgi:hypothetical protein